ncbi:Hypothetical protein I595_2976 [Croceitalea dokdonensis DOKDO 023]|uniref:Lipoprotein n=1 Tax=Croceitalea dokdonensis DOKDO 023 TaxID=1300341 RepID=A0A0P7AXD6_9FLAO|nr:hypothetical protein [Croceitalea dokdonensis]KPM30997.1 Hypothetical protein I595_2976 [Croceitalea dokdonensis DOKDO 023]
MKAIAYTLLAALFSLSACKSQKNHMTEAPLQIGEASSQRWMGGRAESGSGTILEIPLTAEMPNGLELKQAFFRDKIADVRLKTQNGQAVLTANFRNVSLDKPDIIMHADPKQEVGNQPPTPKGKFPFKLADDECMISYMDGDTVKYFKIQGVKEKKARMYQ